LGEGRGQRGHKEHWLMGGTEAGRVFILIWFSCFVLFFWDRVFLYSTGCPGTHSVDQAGLELRNLPAFAFQRAGIKGVCHHTGWILVFKYKISCREIPTLSYWPSIRL
jgi:hypothetical protein